MPLRITDIKYSQQSKGKALRRPHRPQAERARAYADEVAAKYGPPDVAFMEAWEARRTAEG